MLGVQQHQFSNFFMPRILINQHIKGHPRPYFIPEGTSWPPPGTIQNEICVIPLAVKLSAHADRSEEHTSELQSLMRISYAVFCLKKQKQTPLVVIKRTHNKTNS